MFFKIIHSIMSTSFLGVGLDFGTSNTCVVYFENGEVKVIRVNGERTIPTCITIHDGDIHFGSNARRNASRPNALCYPYVKTVIGRMGNNMNAYRGLQTPYELTESNFPNLCQVKNEQRVQISSPQYTVAWFLWNLVQSHEQLKDGKVGVVLTIPATYNASQIHVFREAAEFAGLRVLGIIPEPIGAALRYSQEINRFRYVVVYDLGGGTFDVSVIRHEVNDEYIILNSDGDPCIGGLPFDYFLFDVILKKICK